MCVVQQQRICMSEEQGTLTSEVLIVISSLCLRRKHSLKQDLTVLPTFSIALTNPCNTNTEDTKYWHGHSWKKICTYFRQSEGKEKHYITSHQTMAPPAACVRECCVGSARCGNEQSGSLKRCWFLVFYNEAQHSTLQMKMCAVHPRMQCAEILSLSNSHPHSTLLHHRKNKEGKFTELSRMWWILGSMEEETLHRFTCKNWKQWVITRCTPQIKRLSGKK